MSRYNYLFKIVIIGDHNCGKSCILLRFADGSYRDDHITTIGVDFKLKTISLDKDVIRLEMWDTAGMERYRTIYNSYYHSAHGVMCVYDICDKRSFDNVKAYWYAEVRKHAPSNAVVMLLGNKADKHDERRVDFAMAETFASTAGISLFEVSAKTGINIEDAFIELASCMRERMIFNRAVPGLDAYITHDGYVLDSDDECSSGFHVDGVVSSKPRGAHFATGTLSCCSGGGSGFMNGYGSSGDRSPSSTSSSSNGLTPYHRRVSGTAL